MHSYFCHSKEHCTALTEEMKPEPVWRPEQTQEKRPVRTSYFTTETRGSSSPEHSDR